MFAARKIARETLPLVVIAWATFVVLGGALKTVEKSGFPEQSAALGAGLGLCAVSVAAVFGTGIIKRVRKTRRNSFEKARGVAGVFSAARPAAYTKPPPGGLHPLQVSQVLRT